MHNTPSRRNLWILWFLFFFQFAGVGVYFTFLNVYYRESGLSGAQIGLINMTTALISMGASVGWGYLSDRTGQPRLIIAVGAAAGALLAQAVAYVHTFAAFLEIAVLSSLMSSSLFTLVDSTTLVLLGDRREEYGRYRLGGTFGYILTTSTVGFLFDRLGLRLMFPAFGVIMLAFMATALLLPAVPVVRGGNARLETGAMIRRPAWLLFITIMFLTWIAGSASIQFLGVSLNAMGATQALIGMAVSVSAIIEIPFMAFSGRFLRRYGPKRLLWFAMILMVIRFFLFGWMPSPGWAIPINGLNGISYPLFWNSSVTYANQMAPPGLAGTAQGMLNFATGFAGVASSLLTGWLFDQVGPNGIFIIMAFIVLFAWVLWSVGLLRNRKQEAG